MAKKKAETASSLRLATKRQTFENWSRSKKVGKTKAKKKSKE